jgi:hypothetical protein
MTDTGPEPEVPEDPADPADPEAAAGLEDPADLAGPADPEEEAKLRFREALDRKRALDMGTAGGPAGPGTGKVRGTHGPASSRRSFRRRGGG